MMVQDKKPTFIITWKLMAYALLVFVIMRAVLWFIELKLHIGLGQLGQAIVAAIIGVLFLFWFGRKKRGNV